MNHIGDRFSPLRRKRQVDCEDAGRESAPLCGHVAFYCCVAHGGHPGGAAGESRQWPSITGLCGVGGAGCVACVVEVMARGPASLQL